MVTTRRLSRVSSDREKWDKVFNSLLKIVKELQEENGTLLEERKLLEDLLKSQHERWVFDVGLLEVQISQMKENLEGKDKEIVLARRKCDLLTGLKQREASVSMLKLEHTVDELADIKALLDYHLSGAASLTRSSKKSTRGVEACNCSELGSADSKSLDAEVKRLKHEHKKLASESSSQISALLKEKSFVWNQYNILEGTLNDELKSKQVELEQAKEKIDIVLARMEQLQSSNDEKNELIRRLETKAADMETETNRWKSEASRLSTELELLRKIGRAQVTPVLRKCSSGTKASTRGVERTCLKESNVTVKKESTPIQAATTLNDGEKDSSRSLKRKSASVMVIPDTPKLFTSAFKVPKLKASKV